MWDGLDDNIKKRVLPLLSFFGKKIANRPYSRPSENEIDFMWEREWRKPFCTGSLSLVENDIFVGLCPHEQIDEFESLFSWLQFIDPKRNMKWYADKLIKARQKHDLKHSVV